MEINHEFLTLNQIKNYLATSDAVLIVGNLL